MTRAMIGPFCALAVLAGRAPAQTAVVEVSHNSAVSFISAGEVVTIRATVKWENPLTQFAGLRGNVVATENLGHADTIRSALGLPVPIMQVYGTPVGGSVVGFDVAVLPSFFFGTPPLFLFQNTGLDVLVFDWTAPVVASPTLVEFNFVPAAIAPNVRLYPSMNSPAFIEASTTYIGTSILVLPGPSSGAILVAAGALSPRRRR